jgi:hypothetical protein
MRHAELALRLAGYAYVIDRGQMALAGPAVLKQDLRSLRYLSP